MPIYGIECVHSLRHALDKIRGVTASRRLPTNHDTPRPRGLYLVSGYSQKQPTSKNRFVRPTRMSELSDAEIAEIRQQFEDVGSDQNAKKRLVLLTFWVFLSVSLMPIRTAI